MAVLSTEVSFPRVVILPVSRDIWSGRADGRDRVRERPGNCSSISSVQPYLKASTRLAWAFCTPLAGCGRLSYISHHPS